MEEKSETAPAFIYAIFRELEIYFLIKSSLTTAKRLINSNSCCFLTFIEIILLDYDLIIKKLTAFMINSLPSINIMSIRQKINQLFKYIDPEFLVIIQPKKMCSISIANALYIK